MFEKKKNTSAALAAIAALSFCGISQVSAQESPPSPEAAPAAEESPSMMHMDEHMPSAPKKAKGKKQKEKCYGVAPAGKNDCKSATLHCAATATSDKQKDAWMYVDKGTCVKMGGSTTEG